MTRARQELEAKADATIAPLALLGFSILVAFLAPRYAAWVGAQSAFTARYLAYWPAWLAINALSVVVTFLVRAMQLRENQGAFWRRLDLLLSLASVVVFLVGVVALVMPLMQMGKPP